MAHSNGDLHVYFRKIEQGERTSLSVLAQQIFHGARVLDLGIGSGALGAYLHEKLGCTVDGVTYNAAEADVARAHYQRIEVADLETCALDTLFDAAQYDFIVCADVLEHLRRPEHVLAACRGLLAADGHLLISIPNASYAGLVAELLHGEFRYREEGLLDNTHLRFFTRRSLTRFLSVNGWALDALETIERELPSSEFKVAFDELPPAVARYLLAVPDAMTYQFIGIARPMVAGARVPELEHTTRGVEGKALFSAELYLEQDGAFREHQKSVAAGIIGEMRQTVVFELPGPDRPFTNLRLDPADRPGFLYLHGMTLRNRSGAVLWEWVPTEEGVAELQRAEHRDMLMRMPWPGGAGMMAVLHTTDPWVKLPIPPTAIALAAGDHGSRLEVELGWPMSADYLAASDEISALRVEVEKLKLAAGRASTSSRLLAQVGRLPPPRPNAIQGVPNDQTRAVAAVEIEQIQALMHRNVKLLQQRKLHQSQWHVLQAEASRLGGERAQLAAENESLLGKNDGFLAERAQLGAEIAALKSEAARLALERERLEENLARIHRSRLFRLTQPILRAKGWLGRLIRTSGKPDPEPQFPDIGVVITNELAISLPQGDRVSGSASTPNATAAEVVASSHAPAVRTVDVIVPVFRGLADTRRCIESVLRSKCSGPIRLIVINDASPEPELATWLQDLAVREPAVTLLENPQNLGFVVTANRGMALSEEHDVVLLNSDAEVANDWLDRLRRAAYSSERVATVTPFSNNATICSYPRFCEVNALPEGFDTARLDALFAQANAGQSIDIPTGVGFCMYVRRDCLAEIGLFDTERFGLGYGEENDFCRRAAAAGWRNLHALDTFVAHAGGTSFGESKNARELAAMQTLREMHPDYEPVVHAFVAADPAQPYRQAVDIARLAASTRPRILAISHHLGGGTWKHVTELEELMRPRADTLGLVPSATGEVRLRWLDPRESLELGFFLPQEFEALLVALRAIGVSLIHVHHLLGHGRQIMELPAKLGVPYDFTAHDYYAVCPQISMTDQNSGYCGEQGLRQCGECLHLRRAPENLDIQAWRAVYGGFVADARHVLAPSRDAARRLARYLPAADIRFAPHTDLASGALVPEPLPPPLDSHAPLRVVVIGALSPVKGLDVLEAVAIEAATTASPLEFHLVGYSYRVAKTLPHANLMIHGAYAESDLPDILDRLRPHVVWFPALWPETYSYTLSACLAKGVPVVAPDIGAFTERLSGRRWTWLLPWNTSPAEWLRLFLDMRRNNFETCLEPEPPVVVATTREDALIQPWSYGHDYLHDLPAPRPVSTASSHFVAAHQPGREITVVN